jgi:deazaflavin-dependent oxidoreductase (nitroreductase family)
MQLVTLGGILILALAMMTIAFLLGMRAKSPLVLRPLIALQRAFINPRQMRSAGHPGAYAGVIRHRGRVSGRPYETPVGVVATAEGFLIALPYGSGTNWLQNVLASGSATVVHEGRTYRVERPEIVPMQVARIHFTAADRRSFRWFGTDQALLVREVEPERARERPNHVATGEGAKTHGWDSAGSMRSRHAARAGDAGGAGRPLEASLRVPGQPRPSHSMTCTNSSTSSGSN